MNQETLPPQWELMKDLLPFVARSFSCRLYGLRRYERELKRADLTVEGDG